MRFPSTTAAGAALPLATSRQMKGSFRQQRNAAASCGSGTLVRSCRKTRLMRARLKGDGIEDVDLFRPGIVVVDAGVGDVREAEAKAGLVGKFVAEGDGRAELKHSAKVRPVAFGIAAE